MTRALSLLALWCSPSVQCGNDISERRSGDFCIGKEWRRRRYFVALIGTLAPREFLDASPRRQKLGGLLSQTLPQVLFRGWFLQLGISTLHSIGWVRCVRKRIDGASSRCFWFNAHLMWELVESLELMRSAMSIANRPSSEVG